MAVVFVALQAKSQEVSAAVLLVEYGEVYTSETDQNYKLVTQEELEIISGTFVKTALSSAHILLPNNSVISLDENTVIQLNFGQSSIDIKQIIGNTWHRLENLSGTNSSYQVSTQTAIAAVRGTEFGVSVIDTGTTQETDFMVTENAITATQITLKNGNIEKFNTKDVESGKYCKIKDPSVSQTWPIIDMPDSIKESRLYNKHVFISGFLKDLRKTRPMREVMKEMIKNQELFNFREGTVQGEELESSPEITATVSPTPISSLTPTPTPKTASPTATARPLQPTPTPNPAFVEEYKSIFNSYFIQTTTDINRAVFCREKYYNKKDSDILPLFTAIEAKYGQPQQSQIDLKSAVNAAIAACIDALTDTEIQEINTKIPQSYQHFFN